MAAHPSDPAPHPSVRQLDLKLANPTNAAITMYMKKLILLFTLIPVLTWAFPVATNRLDFDPAQSTGAFDDFLWRWSGFDDQSVEFLFKDVTTSNVGFRLAYPQRGRVFLDILPPRTTNSLTVITNEVLDVYTNFYPAIFNKVTDRGATNLTVTLNYSNGVFLSRTVVTNSSRAGSVQNTEQVLPAAVVVTTQSSPVTNTVAYGQFTNAYVASDNITVTVSNFLENVLAGSTKINGTNYFYFNPTTILGFNGRPFANVTNGFTITRTNNTVNDFIFTAGETYLLVDNVYVAQAVSAQSELSISFGSNTNRQTLYGISISGGTVPRSQSNLFVAANSGTATIYRTYTSLTSNQSITVYSSSIVVYPATTTNLAQSITTNTSASLPATNVVEFAFPSTQRVSRVYSKTETPYSKVTFPIPRTNIPPDGPYFAEVLTYSGASTTNPTQSRTLAKGQVTIENSIWGITNYAGYTNYPGPWSYLLQDGSRPMAGDLNMGGNAVTNASRFAFSDGSSIASSNVALWNSFIQGTNVGLTANTVFDGQVTGLWNNLTLKSGVGADGWSKYAATQTVDFAGNIIDDPTLIQMRANGTTSTNPGALYWNSAFGTLNLVMDKINPDGTPVINEIGYNALVRVKNAGSTTISNTWAVSIVPGAGGILTVERARQPDKTRVIGIASHHIPAGEEGIVNWFGEISQAQTYGTTEGHDIYLSTNTAGINWTTNVAEAGVSPMRLGYIDTAASNPSSGNGKIIVDIFDVEADPIAMAALTNYLPLAGGTINGLIMNGPLNMNDNDIREVSAISDTQDGQVYQINLFEGSIEGPWQFIEQPTIPGYLTTTGAAATYVELNNLPAGIVTTNNLSTIAGSGLGVVSNRLTVTNAPIDLSPYKTNSMDWSFFNATQTVLFANNTSITTALHIGKGSIVTNGLNMSQTILFEGGDDFITRVYGRFGTVSSGGALYPVWYTGSGINSPFVLYGTWNFSPSSYLTISAGNANYWRITTAPTGATANGSSGQMAVSGTNLFIYSPNALGVGTARWLRVSAEANW